jgi:hypothetical protein
MNYRPHSSRVEIVLDAELTKVYCLYSNTGRTDAGERFLLSEPHGNLVFFGHWSSGMVFGRPPKRIWISTLNLAVLHIIGLCADPKMVWIYAESIVAFVKDVISFWNRPFVNLIRHTMGTTRPSSLNGPVSSAVEISGPVPACFRLGYPSPEPLLEWFNKHRTTIITYGGVING